MNIIDTVILSAVEGFTEFLPVSSTGHLIVVADLLGINLDNFTSSFNIAIQLGAILAILLLYGRDLLLDRRLVGKVLLAFIPTAVIGLIFYSLIKEFLLNSTWIVASMFAVGGIVLIAFEYWHDDSREVVTDLDGLSHRQAIIIGLCQSVALVPGVSRSAATIVGGLALGLSRRTIVEFSFLLAVPTMAAAAGYDLLQNWSSFASGQFDLILIGFGLSFVFAWLSVKFLLAYISKYSFVPFGVYRIIVAVLLFWLVV